MTHGKLFMSKELKAQLKSLKHTHGSFTPRAAFVSETRTALLRSIAIEEATIPNKTSVFLRMQSWVGTFLPHEVQVALRPVMSVVLVIGVSVAGFALSASASNTSLPGDILYGVKRATEKTEAVFVSAIGTNANKTEMLAKHAKNRANETKELIAQNKTELVAESVVSLKEAVSEVSQHANDVVENDAADMAMTIAQVAEVQQEIATTLSEAIDSVAGSDNATFVMAQVTDAVQAVVNESVSVAQTIVEKQKNGELEGVDMVSVNEGVKNTLDTAVTSIAQTTHSIEQVITQQTASFPGPVTSDVTVIDTSAVTTTSILIGDTTSTANTISTPTLFSSSTLPIITEVKQTTEAAVQQTQTLVEEGRLLEAIEKTKTVTESVNQVIQDVATQSALISEQQSASGTVVTP
jgi:hypothetical protein